ncbi:mitochondrial outer membrane protein iml2 [Phyllosticta paracitricarpa]
MINDDMKTAERLLKDKHTPFHKLGWGVVVFMRATLGFEQGAMKEAADALSEAENTAADYLRRAQRRPSRSAIYPAGSEYASIQAQAQLMNAIICILNESLTESIRGFYKLRKGFIALTTIMESELTYLKSLDTAKANGTGQAQSSRSSLNFRESKQRDLNSTDAKGLAALTPSKPDSGAGSSSKITTESSTGVEKVSDDSDSALNMATDINATDPSFIGQDPIDVYIHSSTNMCFGVFMILLSLVPPAFGTLLKIVGFRGDRERGLAMLWQSTLYDNIYGGLAGLMLLGYYNGLMGVCDIVPSSGRGSYPRERCKLLLGEMRRRYPRSHLWLLEDARRRVAERQLDESLALLEGSKASPLRQVEALHWFERSLTLMFVHRYEECSEGFQRCCEMNNWSQGLYLYISACAHVEVYRKLQKSDGKAAVKHAKRAEDLLLRTPAHTSKRRLMARQLPFDLFVARKLAKWQARAAARGVSLIDAVGVSPIEEMIYFWNGYKRMGDRHLSDSMEALRWSCLSDMPDSTSEPIDERALHALLTAVALRARGHIDAAKDRLRDGVLCYDWTALKALGREADTWVLPAAIYEMAACLWVENEILRKKKGPATVGPVGEDPQEKERLKECGRWVEKVAKWGEGYDLDSRFGLKIVTAKDTLKRVGIDTVT